MKKFVKHLFLIVSTTLLLVGFSNSTTDVKAVSKESQSHILSIGKSTQGQDGTLINLEKIDVQQKYTSIQSYKMTYWSGGVKTVAYVAMPKTVGAYPLFVNLHGGYIWGENKRHVSSIKSFGVTTDYNSSMLKNSAKNTISLDPMFRGYDQSEGTIQGLQGNTIDTQNAIQALTTFLDSHKDYPDVEKGHLYLVGGSMGGGVALKVAAERTDVLSVIAVSPFVGWDIMGSWYQTHNLGLFEVATYHYGLFDPQAPNYKEQSIDYSKITAPVLIIQGTADQNVPWQPVQTFSQDMKADHQSVTFKLIKDGNHGILNKTTILYKIIDEWNAKHWIN